MRAKVLCLLSFGLLVGCSVDRNPTAGAGVTPLSGAYLPQARAGADLRQARALPMRSARSFAALPDRGDLLAYDRSRKSNQSGAYTWHPVQLSEAHALNAISTGKMEIKSPDGSLINLDYKRHVEHPDGNWSWIGRNADGADAIITFGERAVFGSIPDGAGGSLELTMDGGGAWVMTTDPTKVADPRPRKPDYLVPPVIARAVAERKLGMAKAQAEGSPIDSATVVDVLLGYTVGYATNLGGQSQALTRLNNLVDVANLAYTNSGMSQQVRLVHALQVDYADATDNGDTLEKLTGYKSGTGDIATDPAFAALRAARQTYGADLVSLVRRFRTPENDSCGIAWLIGGGQDPITAEYQAFGYSVVSDGTDVDEGDGKTYFCRQETLAHELGHNMGQAHNQEDSSSTGAHAYSYGYREAAGGFYTVMAYPLADGGQFAIRYFANPQVSYQGRPTGVANTADNVSSLGLTMPIIATFRATVAVSKAANDVNGDGKSDLFWWQPGSLAYSLMNGPQISSSRFFSLSSSYHVAATGDFDGNGETDLLWTSAANDLYVWMGDGIGFGLPVSLGTYGAGWTIYPRAGDIDGDGRSDLVWTRPGQLAFSIMDGPRIASSSFFSVSPAYRVATTGDFDGNGRLDVLWTSDLNDLYAWMGNGTAFSGAPSLGTYSPGWSIVAAGGDVNGDGKTDLLWTQPGQFAYSLLDGPRIASSRFFAVSSAYQVATTGDFDGNGKLDIFWTSSANDVYAWMGDGTIFQPPQYVGNYSPGWSLLP